jgi:hypothetical protein
MPGSITLSSAATDEIESFNSPKSIFPNKLKSPVNYFSGIRCYNY